MSNKFVVGFKLLFISIVGGLLIVFGTHFVAGQSESIDDFVFGILTGEDEFVLVVPDSVVANGDEPAFTDAAFAGDVMATWGASSSFCSLAIPDGNLKDASDCLRMFHVNNCVFLVTGYIETYGWTQDVARPYVSRCLAPLQIVIDAVDSGSPALPRS